MDSFQTTFIQTFIQYAIDGYIIDDSGFKMFTEAKKAATAYFEEHDNDIRSYKRAYETGQACGRQFKSGFQLGKQQKEI